MSWTDPPRTWLAGETPDAATLNQYIRDMLAAIGTPTAWTPVITGSVSNPTASAATGQYVNPGKVCLYSFEYVMATVGSGNYTATLPVAGAVGLFPASFAWATVYDVSLGTLYTRQGLTSGSASSMVFNDNAATRWTSAVPIGMAAGDTLAGHGFYFTA